MREKYVGKMFVVWKIFWRRGEIKVRGKIFFFCAKYFIVDATFLLQGKCLSAGLDIFVLGEIF